MSKYYTILLACITFLIFSCKSIPDAKEGFKPSFSITSKTTHKIPEGHDYTFGYMEVLENRNLNNGKTIKFPVYIFKSRNPNPKKDPVIYTVGGPGSSTMRSAQYMNYYQYLDDRDFILVEQRGTYYAKPHLGCSEWTTARELSNLPDCDDACSDSLFVEAVKSCKTRLLGKGIDLNAYNTNEIAADFNDLVEVLGIEEYNLLTVSYSTKIAQVLMRDYPSRIRSVVMDSALPIEVNYEEEWVANLMEIVDILLNDCTADEVCNTAFPNIKERFYQYLREKSKAPLEVEVENPSNGKKETFYLDGSDLIGVFTLAYTADVPGIPYEINKFLSGDLSSIKLQLASLLSESGDGVGKGMRLSVWCSEEAPFSKQAIIDSESVKYPEVEGLTGMVFKPDVCEAWGVRFAAGIENVAIKSDIPVLLVNGQYDDVTPPKWAAAMRSNLPNSHHIIFKGWKHTPTTNWSNQCAMTAANDFYNNPEILPSPACFEEIDGPEFRIE